MADLTLRLAKGTPLTNAEVDSNFSNLNISKLELSQAQSAGQANALVYFNSAKVVSSSGNLVFTGSNLGIGTSTPTSPLHVIGNILTTGNIFSSGMQALGPELVTNGDFSQGNTGWTLSAGTVAITDGALVFTNSLGVATNAATTYASGRTYQVDFTISNRTAGGILMQLSVGATTPSVTSPVFLANGSYSVKLLSNGNTTLRVIAQGATSLSVTNISVRELIFIADTSNVIVGKQLETALGNATSPAYTFINDTNTGIFSPAADTIAFSEGGSEAMRIDSSGNVGIGTSAPTSKLHVVGTGNITSNVAIGENLQLTNNRLIYLGTPTVNLSRRSFIQLTSDNNYSGLSLRWGSTSYDYQTGPEFEFMDSLGQVRYYSNRANQKATFTLGNYSNNFGQALVIKGGITNYSSPNSIATQELDAQQGILVVKNSIGVSSNAIGALSVLPVYNQSSAGNIVNTDFLINRTETSLGTTPGEQLLFDAEVANVTKVKINTAGTITSNINNNSSLLVGTGYNILGSNANSLIDLSGTWNTTGTPTAIKLNVTDTASNLASLLMDLQVGGSSVAAIRKNPSITVPLYTGGNQTSGMSIWDTDRLSFVWRGQNIAAFGYGYLVFATGQGIGFSPGNSSQSPDLIVTRDSGNILAQRNSNNPQTFRVYNTYTDASNYERGFMSWSTNFFKLGTEKAGTGSARSMYFTTDGTDRWSITSGGSLFAVADNTYDIGASGTNRPRNVWVGGDVNWPAGVLSSAGLAIAASGSITIGTGGGARTNITSSAAGNLRIKNAGSDDFGLLQFGGTTSSFPALKRDGANLQVRLADDSAFASITAQTISGNIAAAYLPDSGVSPGAYGAITEIPTFTVDAKGRITLAANSGTNLDNRYLRLAGAAFQQVQGNVQFEGNVSFLGNVVTVSANNLIVQDNFIYLNDGDNLNNIDFGFVGNYNDGIYRHAGFFRDATDGYWKVFDNYLPEPDAAVDINTGNASYREANFKANIGQFSRITLGNIDGSSLTTTGSVGIGTSAPVARLQIADTVLSGSGSLANSAVDITQTWNTTGTPTAVKVNVTDSASNVNSLLFDLQTGGTSRFSVNKSGVVRLNNSMTMTWTNADNFTISSASGYQRVLAYGFGDVNHHGRIGDTGFANVAVALSANMKLGWGSVAALTAGAIDLQILRDGADTLAQQRSTNPQTFRVYNTYTDASNYERANIGWSGNSLIIGSEAAGTGSTRPLTLLTRNSVNGTVRFLNANPGRSGFLQVSANPSSNVYFHIENDSSSQVIWNGVQLNFGSSTGIQMRHAMDTGRACWGLNVNYPLTNTSYQFRSVATSDSVMAVQGIASQTGDLQRWVNSDGNVLVSVTAAGAIQLANIVNQSAETANLATTSQTQIASFAASIYSSGKFLVQARDTNTGQVHISEILIAHNNVTAVATEYGVVYTGSNVLATYDVDILSGNVRLLASSASSNNTLYKVSETLITS